MSRSSASFVVFLFGDALRKKIAARTPTPEGGARSVTHRIETAERSMWIMMGKIS